LTSWCLRGNFGFWFYLSSNSLKSPRNSFQISTKLKPFEWNIPSAQMWIYYFTNFFPGTPFMLPMPLFENMPSFTINKNRGFQGELVINLFSYSLWIKINPSSCVNYKEKSVLLIFRYNATNLLSTGSKVKCIPNAKSHDLISYYLCSKLTKRQLLKNYLKDFATKWPKCISLWSKTHYILDKCAKLSFLYVIFQNSRKLISRNNRWMIFFTCFTNIHLFFQIRSYL